MRVMIAVVQIAVTMGCVQSAWTQSFPAKPLRVIVPFPPGDTADVLARLVAPRLSDRFAQPVLVENRAGASGQIGLELAARAAPDGYTYAIGGSTTIAVAPHTFKKIPYDGLKDFTPVAVLATNYLAILVHPSTPFRSMKDLVSYARAQPGKLSIGTNGEGTFSHLTIEELGFAAGFRFLHVPYKGAAQITADLLGGQIDGAIGGLTAYSAHVQSGRMRLLAFTNPTRLAQFPDVPVVAESVPGFDSRGWFGVVAPAGVSRDIVLSMNRAFNDSMGSAEVRDTIASLGLVSVQQSPEAFADLIRADFARFAKLVRNIKFQPQ